MKRNLITMCIFYTFVEVFSQDNVLNCTMLKQYVFINAPKEWFKYITKLLKIKLSKRQQNLKEIHIFMKTKKLTINGDKPLKFIKNKTVVYPLGLVRRNLKKSVLVNPYFDGDPERKLEEDKIMFILHEKLRLNLTFYQIYFRFRHFHTCSLGEVKVISHSKNQQVFRYCGIHSNMINYPENRNVSVYLPRVTVRRKLSGIYNVTAFYSVIDTKRIVSSKKHKIFTRNLVWNLYLVPREIRVMKFVLKTKKYQHFAIKFIDDSGLIVEIFDGPGTHSPNIFKKNNKLYVTSTFQCILNLWLPFNKILNTKCVFQFLAESSSVSMKFKLKESFPHTISHAFTTYEVWKILSFYNLNLTVINLTYTGFNDPLCTFAGIAIYSLNKDSHTEITTECISIKNIFTYRNIYSKSNETLLVLYYYKEYGNLSFTIQFSATKCKPVTINTCALSYLCKFPNNTMCKEHREQISSLNLKHSKISTDFPISVKPGECFIFQMVTVADRLGIKGRVPDCKVIFHHINTLNRKIDIHFNIKGYLKCKYLSGEINNKSYLFSSNTAE